jgi:hypothetical protein
MQTNIFLEFEYYNLYLKKEEIIKGKIKINEKIKFKDGIPLVFRPFFWNEEKKQRLFKYKINDQICTNLNRTDIQFCLYCLNMFMENNYWIDYYRLYQYIVFLKDRENDELYKWNINNSIILLDYFGSNELINMLFKICKDDFQIWVCRSNILRLLITDKYKIHEKIFYIKTPANFKFLQILNSLINFNKEYRNKSALDGKTTISQILMNHISISMKKANYVIDRLLYEVVPLVKDKIETITVPKEHHNFFKLNRSITDPAKYAIEF